MLKNNPKLIWITTCLAFLICSAAAGGYAFNTANRQGTGILQESNALTDTADTKYISSGTDTDPEVITKAPNTGDPVMTTADTAAVDTAIDTTEEENTEAETTTQQTAIEKITETADTHAQTSIAAPVTTDTSTPDTTTVPPETEPVYPADGEWNRILVNPTNPLPDGYTPQLINIENGHRADYRVADALNAMLTDCRKAGYNPIICSSYRDIARQGVLFENKTLEFMSYGYTREAAEEYAAKWVARPGTSEHHTGLAFDIVASSYRTLDESQANTPEQKWLMANCHNYGFILRYPEDKTDITGINYEPWHYRYVGQDAAKIITEQGITLEEYLLS